MTDGTEVFAPLADDYAKYRPGYPTEVLDELVRECGLARDWAIADIGSGTGNLARLFLKAGYGVAGVEPNREMREAGERLLAAYPSFLSLDGTAESIPLDALSVDLITVGQAIHWFDIDRARAEFRRILRPGQWVAVLWNDRYDSGPFSREYQEFVCSCATTSPSAIKAPSLETGIDRLFGSVTPHTVQFSHAQRFDLGGLLGRARSSGHIPQPGMQGHDELTAKLTELFARYEDSGVVEFAYLTPMYYGRLDG